MGNSTQITISEAIQKTMPQNLVFKPSKDFYIAIGINKHRFAKIYRGEIEPNRLEIRAICNQFGINPQDVL